MNSGARPVRLDIRPSLWLRLYLFSIHAAAALSLLPLLSQRPWLALLFLPLAVSLGYGERCNRARRLLWQADGTWRLIDGAGRSRDVELLGRPLLLPSLVLLRFSTGGWRRQRVILLPDNSDQAQLRRLRVRLRQSRRQVSGMRNT